MPKKGNIPWNKGIPRREETKQKISEAHKGLKHSQITKQKISINNARPMLGKHHTIKAKKKISLSKLGKKLSPFSLEHIKKLTQANRNITIERRQKLINSLKGHIMTDETKRKISESNKGKHFLTQKQKKHLSEIGKGRKHSQETKRKMKESRAKFVTPKKDTSIEVKLQNFLKELCIEFYTHQYIKDIEHKYQCDIFIPTMNMIIEADGDYWHGNPKMYLDIELNKRQKQKRFNDDIRTKELLKKGYRVVRIWENEIKEMTLDNFKEKIIEVYNEN
jgi:very-short-patch-repair endonuclease